MGRGKGDYDKDCERSRQEKRKLKGNMVVKQQYN